MQYPEMNKKRLGSNLNRSYSQTLRPHRMTAATLRQSKLGESHTPANSPLNEVNQMKIIQYEKQIEDLKNIVALKDNQVNSINEERKEFLHNNKKMKEDIEKINAQHDEKLKELSRKHFHAQMELQDKNQEIEQKDQELKTKDQELETQKQELETQKQELETQKHELESKNQVLADLQKKMHEYERQVALLREEQEKAYNNDQRASAPPPQDKSQEVTEETTDDKFAYSSKQLCESTKLFKGVKITSKDIQVGHLTQQSLRFLPISKTPNTYQAIGISVLDKLTYLWASYYDENETSENQTPPGLRIIDISSNNVSEIISFTTPDIINCIKQHDKKVFAGLESGQLIVFDAQIVNNSKTPSFETVADLSAPIYDFIFFNDLIIILSGDSMKVWNCSKKKQIKSIKLPFQCYKLINIRNEYLLVDRFVYDLKSFSNVCSFEKHIKDVITAFCYVPLTDEIWIATHLSILIFSAKNFEFVGAFSTSAPTNSLICLGKYVWSVNDNYVCVWFIRLRALIREILLDSSIVTLYEFTSFPLSDNKLGVISFSDQDLVLFNSPYSCHKIQEDPTKSFSNCILCNKKITGTKMNCGCCKEVPLHFDCTISFVSLVHPCLSVIDLSKFEEKNILPAAIKSKKASNIRSTWEIGGLTAKQIDEIIVDFSKHPLKCINELFKIVKVSQSSILFLKSTVIRENVKAQLEKETNVNSGEILHSIFIARFLYEFRARLPPHILGKYLVMKGNHLVLESWIEQINLIRENIEMSWRRVLISSMFSPVDNDIKKISRAFAQIYAPMSEPEFHGDKNLIEYFTNAMSLLDKTIYHPSDSLLTLSDFLSLTGKKNISKNISEYCFHQISTEGLKPELFSLLPLPVLQGLFIQDNSQIWVEFSVICITIKKYMQLVNSLVIKINNLKVGISDNSSLILSYYDELQKKFQTITIKASCTYAANLWCSTLLGFGAKKY